MTGPIFSVLIYLVIGFFVFRKLRQIKGRTDTKKPGAGTGVPVNRPVSTMQKPVPVSSVQRSRKNNGVNVHMAREKINIRGWEDRKGDWLAKQMAEEKISEKRVSEMFQLKLEHRYNCEAEMMKQFHEAACDAAGVDNGEHK